MEKKTKRYFSLWLPVVIWCALIFYLSSRQAPPATGVWFFDFVLPNLAHLIEYGVLFVLSWRATKSAYFSFLLPFFYALTDEFHQSLVPTRTPSVNDLFVDTLGMIFAWLIIWKLLPKAPRRLKSWAKNWQVL